MSFIPEYIILLAVFLPFIIAITLVMLHWLNLAKKALEEGQIRIESIESDLLDVGKGS